MVPVTRLHSENEAWYMNQLSVKKILEEESLKEKKRWFCFAELCGKAIKELSRHDSKISIQQASQEKKNIQRLRIVQDQQSRQSSSDPVRSPTAAEQL